MAAQRDPWIRCSPTDRRLIESIQGHVRPIPADEVVQSLVKRYEQAGSHVAVIDGERQWTYAELGRHVFGLAHRLSETYGLRDSGDSKVFGVSIDRSAHLLAAVHAIAMTGSAYCPLNPGDPVAWKQNTVRTSGATAVLVSGAALGQDSSPPRFGSQFVIDLDGPGKPDFTVPEIDEDGVLQVIFTSGSTGRPKGVRCTYTGFANRIRWMQETFPLDESDRVALKTPITFDVAGWEMFWPQYAGAQTVVVPPGAHTSPEALISLFNEHRVTVAHFVPSMLRLWLRAGGGRRCPHLRLVFSSGEALGTDLAEEFKRQSGAQLHNLYGPTEAAIDVTHFPLGEGQRHPVPIGHPITNIHIYILDQDKAICPVGEQGEIYIQGVGVALGYLGAGEEEEARFSPLPSGAPREWRSFRTGDAGRYAPDGQIEFCGRLDDQVKIRGQRVEPAEAETALRTHESVLDACVRPHVTSSGRTQLVAYVVLGPSTDLVDPQSELSSYLEGHLPERSVPARIVVIESLPLGPHGKVDANRLPQPGRSRPAISSPYQEPTTPLEAQIAAIWAHVLDLDEVGVHDDFHDLGGDSLAAVEISFVLAERLGFDYDDPLIPEILMNGNTVAKSAHICTEAGVQ